MVASKARDAKSLSPRARRGKFRRCEKLVRALRGTPKNGGDATSAPTRRFGSAIGPQRAAGRGNLWRKQCDQGARRHGGHGVAEQGMCWTMHATPHALRHGRCRQDLSLARLPPRSARDRGLHRRPRLTIYKTNTRGKQSYKGYRVTPQDLRTVFCCAPLNIEPTTQH